MKDYVKEAEEFCARNGVRMSVGEPEYGYPAWDGERKHWIFPVTLSRRGRRMTVRFAQSLAAGAEEPGAYDVLACLVKGAPGDFGEFCREFGYDGLPLGEYPRVMGVYRSAMREWKGVERVFGDVIEELGDIC